MILACSDLLPFSFWTAELHVLCVSSHLCYLTFPPLCYFSHPFLSLLVFAGGCLFRGNDLRSSVCTVLCHFSNCHWKEVLLLFALCTGYRFPACAEVKKWYLGGQGDDIGQLKAFFLPLFQHYFLHVGESSDPQRGASSLAWWPTMFYLMHYSSCTENKLHSLATLDKAVFASSSAAI